MIGERIKNTREKKGFSLTELAKRADVSKSYLSYIEREVKINPSLQFLSKLANSLDTSVEYLLGEVSKDKGTIDEEWKVLLTKAIEDGMSKEDFSEFRNFITFKNWNQHRK